MPFHQFGLISHQQMKRLLRQKLIELPLLLQSIRHVMWSFLLQNEMWLESTIQTSLRWKGILLQLFAIG